MSVRFSLERARRPGTVSGEYLDMRQPKASASASAIVTPLPVASAFVRAARSFLISGCGVKSSGTRVRHSPTRSNVSTRTPVWLYGRPATRLPCMRRTRGVRVAERGTGRVKGEPALSPAEGRALPVGG